jgi:hypothetical protein
VDLCGQALPFSEPLDLALAVRQRLLRAPPLAEVRVEQGGELRLYSGVTATGRWQDVVKSPGSFKRLKGKSWNVPDKWRVSRRNS